MRTREEVWADSSKSLYAKGQEIEAISRAESEAAANPTPPPVLSAGIVAELRRRAAEVQSLHSTLLAFDAKADKARAEFPQLKPRIAQLVREMDPEKESDLWAYLKANAEFDKCVLLLGEERDVRGNLLKTLEARLSEFAGVCRGFGISTDGRTFQNPNQSLNAKVADVAMLAEAVATAAGV